jgi:hypothetical protein
MSASIPELPAPSEFDSRDCVNLLLEAQGDTTVRPLRPQLLKMALAERERLARSQQQGDVEGAEAPSDTPPARE